MNKSIVKLVALALLSAAAVSSVQAKSCKKRCEDVECEAAFTNDSASTVAIKIVPKKCNGRMHHRIWKQMRRLMHGKRVASGSTVRMHIPNDVELTLLVRPVGPSNSPAASYDFAAGELCGCHTIGCPDECGVFPISHN